MTFDWSQVNRWQLLSQLQLNSQFLDGDVPVQEFHNHLSQRIRELAPVRVIRRSDAKPLRNIAVGGLYDSSRDYRSKTCIDIVVYYPKSKKTIKLSRYRWQKVRRYIVDVLMHEIIHLKQERARNFKTLIGYSIPAYMMSWNREQRYYGQADEIGAYAFNIASELYDRFGNDLRSAQKFVAAMKPHQYKLFPSLRMYLQAFDGDWSHPTMQRLMRKVYRCWPKVHYGSPYKPREV